MDINEKEFSPEVIKAAEDELQASRKKLLDLMVSKVPAGAKDIVSDSFVNIIGTLSKDDCDNMYKIVQEKGLMGAMLLGKKMKKKLQKDNSDLTSGRM